MSEPTVQLTEDRGWYIERWACEPPSEDATYRVFEDEWETEGERPVRTILRWEAPPDAEDGIALGVDADPDYFA